MKRIPLLDLKAQHANIGGEVMAAVSRSMFKTSSSSW